MTTTTHPIKVDFLTRPIFRCRWGKCGGNVVWGDNEDGYSCIQCGRAHDKNGNLIVKTFFKKG